MGKNGKERIIIGQLLKYSALIIAGLIVSLIASAYVWYFVGMAVSLAAGAILGLTGGTIAQTFACIGVGAAVYWFALFIGKIIDGMSLSKVEMSEEELNELLDALNDEGKDDVD